MDIEIRPYDHADLASVIRIWENASEVGHPFLDQTFLLSERENIGTTYLPNGDAWVALTDNQVVGFTILHGKEVGALFVDPCVHSQGVGFRLLCKAKEIHGQLKVQVFKQNVNGYQFYKRFGFTFQDEYLHEESGMMMLRLEYG